MTTQQIIEEFAETRAAFWEQLAYLSELGLDMSNTVVIDVQEHFDAEYPEDTAETLEARRLICEGALEKLLA